MGPQAWHSDVLIIKLHHFNLKRKKKGTEILITCHGWGWTCHLWHRSRMVYILSYVALIKLHSSKFLCYCNDIVHVDSLWYSYKFFDKFEKIGKNKAFFTKYFETPSVQTEPLMQDQKVLGWFLRQSPTNFFWI